MNFPKDNVIIYCDGACKGNPGVGGWGAVIMMGDDWKKKVYGSDPYTTNNRMELSAALYSITAVKDMDKNGNLPSKLSKIKIYTDSTYLKSGITEWIKKWKINNWGSGKIKNQDLWKALDAEIEGLDIEWLWVKGHSNDKYNDMADAIANEAIKKSLLSK